MKWNEHIRKIVGKANDRVRFMRTILGNSSLSVKESAYKTVGRPILEYCSSVGYPHLGRFTEDIEAIQRRAARLVTAQFDHYATSTDMLRELKWQSLESRRDSFRETLLRKFRHRAFEAECKDILLPPMYITLRDHKDKRREIRARKNAPFVVAIGNKLT